MRRFGSTVLLAAAMAGGAYGFYRYGMSDEDREKLGRMVDSARALAQEIVSRVGPLLEQVGRDTEYSDMTNREDTRRQWTELGY